MKNNFKYTYSKPGTKATLLKTMEHDYENITEEQAIKVIKEYYDDEDMWMFNELHSIEEYKGVDVKEWL